MHPSRRGLTLVEFVVVMAILVLIVVLLWPSVTRSREVARRTQCRNNLKLIGLALHNYHDEYGRFPPAYTVDADGRRLHSWRTLLLPYLDQKELYSRIDLTKPWDHPANTAVRETVLSWYACPSSQARSPLTTYMVIASPDGILRPNQSLSVPEMTDGTASTLMVIEVDAEHAVPWMSPEDIDESWWLALNAKSPTSHSGGMHGLFADGSVRFLNLNLSTDVRKALVTATAGDKVPNDF